MASQSTLEPFDPTVESVEDYKERFDFHCTALGIREERQKALFLTRIGREAFLKVKTLASPTPLADLDLAQIVTFMKQHYKRETVEIAERFKFFKRVQQENEPLVDYLAELRKLAKTCNFGGYLETALRDQLVCGLRDQKTQKELLCIPDLTIAGATDKARAAEVINREAKQMNPDPVPTHQLSRHVKQTIECHRCGKQGHTGANCIHKDKRCHYCKKVGHLSSACLMKKKNPKSRKEQKSKKGGTHPTHRVDAETSSSSEEEFDAKHNHVHHTDRTATRHKKLTTTLLLDGVEILMEIDTGAELSTIPFSQFQKKLSHAKLKPSTVKLRQYDGSELPVKGEIEVRVQKDQQTMTGRFVLVGNTHNQLPLLGRDWLYKLKLNWAELLQMTKAKSVHNLEVESIKTEFADVFKEDLGLLSGIEAEIELKEGASPKFCKPRPIPFALRTQVEEELRRQVADGELQPVDQSEWATPIVVVTRKDRKLRICADFKVTINPHLKVPTYPLPTPDEVFAALANGESFTKLDLSRAYKQMRVASQSQGYLTITTHLGLFKYLRLPFGIASAPAIWQKAMAVVLQGCPRVIYYLDDILVTGTTREEHEKNLRLVLSRLQKFGLRLNASKCKFFQTSVEYLGHLITPKGVSPTQERVKSVVEAPAPRNKSELKSFLGMITFNARFLPSMSTMLHPMYNLLRNDTPWKWTKSCQQAFDQAKISASKAPVLAHYDVAKPIKLYCDASPYGVGACMMHIINGKEQPVAYASRTLSQAEINYAQIEGEALALIFGVKKFNQYLYGRQFTLVTDHRPLCKLFGHKEEVRPLAAARMQRWALILSAYTYKIEYVPGSDNKCADCLSRLPRSSTSVHPAESGSEVHAMNIDNLPVTAKLIAKKTAKDTVLAKLSTYIQHGTWPSPLPDDVIPYFRKKLELTIQDECILWGKRVIIPEVLRAQLLKELHVGHVGICRMKALARSHIWWPHLDHDIEAMTAQCEACKITTAMPTQATPHPWQYPSTPWERVHIDYGEWNKTDFLVLVDAFSKWPEVKVVSSTTTQKTIDVLSEIFATHGFPRVLVSDNGPQFTAIEFREFMQQNDIVHYRSPPYHPSSNGLAENMVKNVKHHLKRDFPDSKVNINRSVSTFLRTYRNVPHTTTDKSPADLILIQAPRTRLSLTSPNVFQRVKTQLQSNSKQQPHREREYRVGDPVLVRDLRPGQHSKWQNGTITAVLGGPRYQVDINGQHSRQVHVDHLQPGIQQNEGIPDVPHNATVPVELAHNIMPEVDEAETLPEPTVASPVIPPILIEPPRRSTRQITPPKRLIEEID